MLDHAGLRPLTGDEAVGEVVVETEVGGDAIAERGEPSGFGRRLPHASGDVPGPVADSHVGGCVELDVLVGAAPAADDHESSRSISSTDVAARVFRSSA